MAKVDWSLIIKDECQVKKFGFILLLESPHDDLIR